MNPHKETACQTIDRLLMLNTLLGNALLCLYQDTADYIRINHLGSTHHNFSMEKARRALKKTGRL